MTTYTLTNTRRATTPGTQPLRGKKHVWQYSAFVLATYALLLLHPMLVRAQVQKDCTNDPTSDLCHPYPAIQGGVLEILGKGLQVVLGMIGVVAFIMIIAGAARWMTAGGTAEHVDKGKGMIAWAFLGLVLAAAAFAITDFIFGGLRGALFGG